MPYDYFISPTDTAEQSIIDLGYNALTTLEEEVWKPLLQKQIIVRLRGEASSGHKKYFDNVLRQFFMDIERLWGNYSIKIGGVHNQMLDVLSLPVGGGL